MDVVELIQSAAFKAGIVSSFNRDELPDDVQEAGRNVLASEILPSVNCDRTLDITVTSRVYQPVGGRIVLKPFKPRDGWKLLGYSQYNSTELDSHWSEELARLGITAWPETDLGEPMYLAMWTTDMKLVAGSDNVNCDIVPGYNIDFPPMRVESVIESTSRFEHGYLYRDEFERTVLDTIPGVYTTEEYDDQLIVLIKGTNAPKVLILPVPLQIVNATHNFAGEIKAPEKFRRYLIDCLAVSLAIIYGVSSLPAMEKQQAVSYNLLKKNKPQPLHEANVSERVQDKLRTDRRLYGRFGF